MMLLSALCFVLTMFSGSEARMRVVDLTHVISNRTLYWPGIPGFSFSVLHRGQKNGHWLESNWFGTSEHGGTHLDAPAHVHKDGNKVHLIPPERLVGPGVVIDVSSKAAKNPDYQVLRRDIIEWEHKYGRIPEGAVVMMNSGWGKRHPNRKLVLNSKTDDPATFHYPGWHIDTATWLVKHRKVIVVGTDTPSNDYGHSPDFPVHRVLARNNVSGLENIANLDALPPRGMLVFVGVSKVYDGSGGPARVIAVVKYHSSPKSKTARHMVVTL